MFARVPRIAPRRCGRPRPAASRRSSGTGCVHRPGPGEGRRQQSRALRLLRFEDSRGRPSAASMRDQQRLDLQPGVAHARDPAARRPPGPALHANAWTKRSSRSGASTTPLRPTAVRSRARVGGHPLHRRQLVAQRGRLLEPAAGERARASAARSTQLGSTSGSPSSHRRAPAPPRRSRPPPRHRGRAPGSGRARRPGTSRRPPAAAGRHVRRPQALTHRRRGGLCTGTRTDRAGRHRARMRSCGHPQPRYRLVGGEREVAASLGVRRTPVGRRPQAPDQLQLEQRRFELRAQRPGFDPLGRRQRVLDRPAGRPAGEVRPHPGAQVGGLANVQHLPVPAVKQVHARSGGRAGGEVAARTGRAGDRGAQPDHIAHRLGAALLRHAEQRQQHVGGCLGVGQRPMTGPHLGVEPLRKCGQIHPRDPPREQSAGEHDRVDHRRGQPHAAAPARARRRRTTRQTGRCGRPAPRRPRNAGTRPARDRPSAGRGRPRW